MVTHHKHEITSIEEDYQIIDVNLGNKTVIGCTEYFLYFQDTMDWISNRTIILYINYIQIKLMSLL